MKKRILAFLLAVSIAVSMLVLPASAAGNANTAVQLSITLNAMDSSQQAALNALTGNSFVGSFGMAVPKGLKKGIELFVPAILTNSSLSKTKKNSIHF